MSTKAQVKTQAKTPAAPGPAHFRQLPVAVPAREADRPDIATQLEGAARLGHSLGAISVRSAAPSQIQAKPLIQRQELPEEEEELQMQREPSPLQRQEKPEEEEEELQMQREPSPLQRQELPEEEEEKLQMKPDLSLVGLEGGPVAPDVEAAIRRARGGAASEVRQENRTGLPDNLKAGLEDLSGLAMDDVRVHYDSSKPAEINARAFTQGKDIHIASGQEKHLPHEGWHVVQQAQGGVKPTMQLKDGVLINDDQGLEQEADDMAKKVFPTEQGLDANKLPHVVQPMGSGNLVQRRLWDNVPTRFQTENDLGAANSEYLITSGGYRRFAPVNILRNKLDQVFFNEPNRSFVYVTGMPDDLNSVEWDAAFEKPRVLSIVGMSVNFISETRKAPLLVASTVATEGAFPYDIDVDNDGRVDPDTAHVGHKVTNVGAPLPTLDDPETLLEVRKQLKTGQRNPATEAIAKNVAEVKKSPYI